MAGAIGRGRGRPEQHRADARQQGGLSLGAGRHDGQHDPRNKTWCGSRSLASDSGVLHAHTSHPPVITIREKKRIWERRNGGGGVTSEDTPIHIIYMHPIRDPTIVHVLRGHDCSMFHTFHKITCARVPRYTAVLDAPERRSLANPFGRGEPITMRAAW